MAAPGRDPLLDRPVVGWRARFGVIIPSTNIVVEHDFHQVRPEGVSFHAGLMHIPRPVLDSDESFQDLIGQIRASIDTAIRDCITAEPEYLIMGMSAETFWDGVEGNRRFEERVRARSGGLAVSTGATACRRALETLGCKRICVFSPYQPIADREVGRFFTEAGFEVLHITGLRCPSATAIAAVTEARLLEVLHELDAYGPDAIVQVGTNLSMLRLADEAERWLGKPVIAINAATLWHALRARGIDDRIHGFGSLLREH